MFSKKFIGLTLVLGLVVALSGAIWQMGGADWATSVIQFIAPSGENSMSLEKQQVLERRQLISPVNPLPTKEQIRWLMATSTNKRVLYNQFVGDGVHAAASTNPLDSLHPCQMYVMAMNIFMDQPNAYEYQMPGKWFNKQCANQPEFKKSLEAFKSCLAMSYEMQANFGDINFQNYIQDRFNVYCRFAGEKALDKDLSLFDGAKDKFCADEDAKIKNGQMEFADLKAYYDQDCHK